MLAQREIDSAFHAFSLAQGHSVLRPLGEPITSDGHNKCLNADRRFKLDKHTAEVGCNKCLNANTGLKLDKHLNADMGFELGEHIADDDDGLDLEECLNADTGFARGVTWSPETMTRDLRSLAEFKAELLEFRTCESTWDVTEYNKLMGSMLEKGSIKRSSILQRRQKQPRQGSARPQLSSIRECSSGRSALQG